MGREVGSSLFCFDRQLTLVSYILKRKKCVLLLSTMHHDDAFTLKTQNVWEIFCKWFLELYKSCFWYQQQS
ncbi:hypothetical protein T08_13600 [Trichinella sp. T8]|nr:hypothetical protein T08_13600 [Trichinella sp. T8]